MVNSKDSVFVRFYKDKLGNIYEHWKVNDMDYLYRQKDEKCVIADKKMFEKLTKF